MTSYILRTSLESSTARTLRGCIRLSGRDCPGPVRIPRRGGNSCAGHTSFPPSRIVPTAGRFKSRRIVTRGRVARCRLQACRWRGWGFPTGRRGARLIEEEGRRRLRVPPRVVAAASVAAAAPAASARRPGSGREEDTTMRSSNEPGPDGRAGDRGRVGREGRAAPRVPADTCSAARGWSSRPTSSTSVRSGCPTAPTPTRSRRASSTPARPWPTAPTAIPAARPTGFPVRCY